LNAAFRKDNDWEKEWDGVFSSRLKDIIWTCGKDSGTYNDSAKDFIRAMLWRKDIELRNMKSRLKEVKNLEKEVDRFATRLRCWRDLRLGVKDD